MGTWIISGAKWLISLAWAQIKTFSVTKLLDGLNPLKGSMWGKVIFICLIVTAYNWASHKFFFKPDVKPKATVTQGDIHVSAPFAKPDSIKIDYHPTSTTNQTTVNENKKFHTPWWVPIPYVYGSYSMNSPASDIMNLGGYRAEAEVGLAMRIDLDFWNQK